MEERGGTKRDGEIQLFCYSQAVNTMDEGQ